VAVNVEEKLHVAQGTAQAQAQAQGTQAAASWVVPASGWLCAWPFKTGLHRAQPTVKHPKS